LQLQSVTWMRPPETLLALLVVAAFSRSFAEVTVRRPRPPTVTRTWVWRTPGPASTCSWMVVPVLAAGLAEFTLVSASTVATGGVVGQNSVVCAHPVAGMQASAVQTLASLQLADVSVCTQPEVGLHVSAVQELPSLQSSAGVPP